MERLTLRIPRELRSPNAWLWKHWRIKQRETQQWEAAIALLTPMRQRVPWAQRMTAEPTRVRVVVSRLVPSRRNFIRDDDNLRFSVKPVNDALKRLQLIHSDAREWLEQPMPTQAVAPDGQYATVIEIEALKAIGAMR